MSTSIDEVEKTRDAVDQRIDLTVADAVWVGTAILQRKMGETGSNRGFSTEDIVHNVERLQLTKGLTKSIWQHVNQHCVANRPPQPNRSRMLYALGGGIRRLFRDGDKSDPGRKDAPTHPEWNKLPRKYQDLRAWYENEWNRGHVDEINDPLLSLVGTWKDESADDYIAHLRKNWGSVK